MGRRAISDSEKRAIRSFYANATVKPSQRAILKWFEARYNHRLAQATISEVLSARYAYLDQITDDSTTVSYRQRSSKWPILEAILFEWQQGIEQQGGVTSTEILLHKAEEFWTQIPQYSHLPTPSFSTGWLSKFKRRHNISKRHLHGEAGSVPTNADDQMRAIRTECGQYSEEDIFNMDEIGLYWRMAPHAGLASAAQPGIKKIKARISIICCSNYTGTQRLPLWVIGKAKQPRTLRGFNLNCLNVIWTSNSKAWMTQHVMAEWLQAFYRWVGDRSVLLLMDNLSAHLKGIEIQPPPNNVRIQWLPPNTTSIYQPLDQGIIHNFKQLYKRQWLEFMVKTYEKQGDPLTEMTLLHALRWASTAWQYQLSNSTIYRCFRKARILPSQDPIDLPSEPVIELNELYQRAVQAGEIDEALDLTSFLNPSDENEGLAESTQVVFDIDEVILRHTDQQQQVEEVEIEDHIVVERIPSVFEAVDHLRLLRLTLERQDFTKDDDIRHLVYLQRRLEAVIEQNKHQTTLNGWLSQN